MKRWILTAFATGVALAVAAAAWATAQDDRYQTSVVVAIGPTPELAVDADLIDVVGSIDRSGMPATMAGIASSRSVRDATATALGLPAGALRDYEVDSLPVLSANLVDITVTGPDPNVVAELANAIAAEAGESFEALYRVYDVVVVTDATAPTRSGRPPVVLVVAGAFAGGVLVVAAIALAMNERWRHRWSGAIEP